VGTSASSSGPAGGVPLVPPWVPVGPQPTPPNPPAQPNPPIPPHPPENPIPLNVNIPAGQATPQPTSTPQIPAAGLSQPRRFIGARGSMGRFAKGGHQNDLRKALGKYVKTGIGGSAVGARRMAGTARTASNLFNTLSGLQTGQITTTDLGVNPQTLAGRTAREVIDIIIEAIRPIDGTQDTEISRQSIDAATSDLLTLFPNIELTSLTQNQIEILIEHYVAHDICKRIDLDFGNTVQLKAPNASTAVTRLEEMKDFILAEVRSTFGTHRGQGGGFQRGRVEAFITNILRDVLHIFEEYVN